MTISPDSAKFSRALNRAVTWPVAVIFVTAVLLLFFVFVLFRVINLSDHSFAVIAETRTCENLTIDSQNETRGYLLTGDASFENAFESDQAQIGPALDHLKNLVQDNPQQALCAENIQMAENAWLEHGRNMLAHRDKSTDLNADWVREGRTLLAAVSKQIDIFTDNEIKLRDQRQSNVRRMRDFLYYGGSVIALLLAFVVAYLVRQQMVQLEVNYREALATIEQRRAAIERSEADLEEQKEWLRVTLTSIGDGVIVTDPDCRILLMNHEAERLTGWPLADALHQPLTSIFKIIDELTRSAVESPVRQVLREKKVVSLPHGTLLLSRTGEEWAIEDSAAPICDAKGNALGVVMVVHDATEMRHTQKELRAYSLDLEKKVADRTTTLQQTVTELEAFSYTVSHDLRSPLRAMQGFSEAVLEDYGDKIDARGKNYLERIKNAAERLDRLIQDLLSYTRISRQDLPMEALDLNKLVHDIIENYPHLNSPAAEITVEGTFPKVFGREAPLTQVLSNLLGNAVRFTKPNTVPIVRIWGEEKGDRFRLWIEDDGIGIAPEYQERIFQMFVQVNEPGRYGGTGVGLAIVKKAVQTMRGTVGVESEPGAGSKFWVELIKAS